MKCEDVQMLIEDFVDSTLDQKNVALVESHMGRCAACAKFCQQLSREQAIYALYERDVEVTPALWVSIDTRIKQERAARPVGLVSRLRESLAAMFAGPRLSPAFAGALVILAIGITVGVMTYLNSRGPETTVAGGNRNTSIPPDEPRSPAIPDSPAPNTPKEPGVVASNAGTPTSQPITPSKVDQPTKRPSPAAVLTPAQLVRDAEQKYLAAISMLSRDVNRQRSQLDPNLLARFDASLSDIERTIKETRRVVRENPGDPIALQYLLAAYSKKVEMLRGMTTD